MEETAALFEALELVRTGGDEFVLLMEGLRDVADVLHVADCPRDLRLEITEAALMEKVAPAMAVLRRLHEIDLRLHLADFGTGYSSLSLLHRVPVEALKIDRSFVVNLCSDAASLSIARSIVALARALHIQVIAEGEPVDAAAATALLTPGAVTAAHPPAADLRPPGDVTSRADAGAC